MDAHAFRIQLAAALDLAEANRIGAVTDAQQSLADGTFPFAAHYATDANYWRGRAEVLREVIDMVGER
jgi:hypothetical protein